MEIPDGIASTMQQLLPPLWCWGRHLPLLPPGPSPLPGESQKSNFFGLKSTCPIQRGWQGRAWPGKLVVGCQGQACRQTPYGSTAGRERGHFPAETRLFMPLYSAPIAAIVT